MLAPWPVSQRAKLYLDPAGKAILVGRHYLSGRNTLSGSNTARDASLACLVLVYLAGCDSPPDPRRTNFRIEKPGITMQYDDKTGRLKRIEVDQNKNGRMDTWSYWNGTRLLRIETDGDEDGKIDRWEHFGPDGTRRIVKLGTSSKDDGVEDTWAYPDEKDLLLRVETDTDRDGTIDKRESFVASPNAPGGRVLSMVELGLDKTGQPARRLYYRPDGSFDKTEVTR